jgi:predicted nucleic acid-binding Zn ribbon protein
MIKSDEELDLKIFKLFYRAYKKNLAIVRKKPYLNQELLSALDNLFKSDDLIDTSPEEREDAYYRFLEKNTIGNPIIEIYSEMWNEFKALLDEYGADFYRIVTTSGYRYLSKTEKVKAFGEEDEKFTRHVNSTQRVWLEKTKNVFIPSTITDKKILKGIQKCLSQLCLPVKHCSYCGKSFNPTDKRQVYCLNACRQADYRKRKSQNITP